MRIKKEMKLSKAVSLTLVMLLVVATTVSAQTRRERVRSRVDSVLTARYFNTPYDTNYVVRPEGRLTLKFRLNQTGNGFHAKGTVNDIYSKADLHTSHKTTVAVVAIYRGIAVGVAINPGKLIGSYKDYEFNLNYYSSRLSLDASYQRSTTLAGNIERDGMHQLESGDVTMKVLNLAGYYTFNARQFSYPAAFTQSYIQRRSAGSWLAGFSYQGGSIKTNAEKLKARGGLAPDVRIYTGHLGLGGGYGYNWVLGKKWLLHFSALPTFVVYNRNNFTVNGERKRAKHIRFNMIFNERLAIVRNFSPRYFAGATLVMNNSVFDDDVVVVNQNKWRARAFIGLRL